MSEYEELQKKLEAACKKDEAKQRAIRAKRAEKQAVKKAGGGRAIAKAIMSGPTDTDFGFGHNEVVTTNEGGPDIDRRIAEEAAGRCMGRVYCQVCKTFHGYCVEVAEDKERLKMLPTGNESAGSGQKRKGGMDWLKNEDLNTTGKEAKILMVRYNKEGRFGARVEMKLAIDGMIRYWGVPPKSDDRNPNYKLLTDKFGHDENNWVEQRIILLLVQDDFSQQYFVRVDFPSPAAKQSRR